MTHQRPPLSPASCLLQARQFAHRLTLPDYGAPRHTRNMHSAPPNPHLDVSCQALGTGRNAHVVIVKGRRVYDNCRAAWQGKRARLARLKAAQQRLPAPDLPNPVKQEAKERNGTLPSRSPAGGPSAIPSCIKSEQDAQVMVKLEALAERVNTRCPAPAPSEPQPGPPAPVKAEPHTVPSVPVLCKQEFPVTAAKRPWEPGAEAELREGPRHADCKRPRLMSPEVIDLT